VQNDFCNTIGHEPTHALQHDRPHDYPVTTCFSSSSSAKRKTASRGGLSEVRSGVFDQAAASAEAFFRFLRQPNRPNAPRPLAKSGRAAGSGVADTDVTVTSSRANALGTSKELNINVSDPVAVTSNMTSTYKGIVVPLTVPVDAIFVLLNSTVPLKSASSWFEFGGVGFKSPLLA
jgi:hypothetical protein